MQYRVRTNFADSTDTFVMQRQPQVDARYCSDIAVLYGCVGKRVTNAPISQNDDYTKRL